MMAHEKWCTEHLTTNLHNNWMPHGSTGCTDCCGSGVVTIATAAGVQLDSLTCFSDNSYIRPVPLNVRRRRGCSMMKPLTAVTGHGAALGGHKGPTW